jgi:hypothetical protein
MPETSIMLVLMLVPLLNLLAGAFVWGPVGFVIGVAISVAMPLILCRHLAAARDVPSSVELAAAVAARSSRY